MKLDILASKLPTWLKGPLRRLLSLARIVLFYGHARFCPVCGRSSRRFRSFGVVPRPDAQCPHCGALERHRLLWLYFTARTNLFENDAKKMLHVAPEGCFEPLLRKRLGDHYLTADLFDPNAMVKMDITDINYPDGFFDVIYCSHVLEHVPDDLRAMQEFHRVLKDDGWAVLLVPIIAEKTFEDPSITDPGERLRVFGQADHVRSYGPDYVDRLRDAGFRVVVTTATDLVPDDDILRMGLTPASGEIFYCTKQ